MSMVSTPTTARAVKRDAAITDCGVPPVPAGEVLDDEPAVPDVDEGLLVDEVPVASLPLLKTRTYAISKYAVS